MQRQLSSLLLKDPLFMIRSTSVRLYQSENGVFGYKPKVKKSFSIPESVLLARQEQSNFVRWIDAFRANAHRVALINPVEFMPVERNIPELEASRYGLTDYQQVDTEGILNINQKQATISELKSILNDIYCGSISAEFSHCDTEHEREFLASNIEQLRKDSISDTTRKEIATLLLKSQTWDVFLAKKFPTVKRYGGEGAETIFAFFRELMHVSVRDGLDHIVVGMPHRGRLNLLAIMMGTPPAKIFNKFKGFSEFPAGAKGMADIATHFDVAEELNVEGKPLRISLLHNPSHLEAVNAVAMGKARSKQQSLRDGAFGHDAGKPFASSVLSVILHGDAAFAGQGINQECLIMAGTPHFDVGGSIHLIVNNQVGFTTPGSRGRATRYSSDLAKSIGAPILHVNGDDPEALLLATQLAFNYQREFRKDVFIDLNCFRRWGHNELDDPTFTNPAQYSVIHARKSIPDVYAEKLVEKNIISLGDIELINSSYWDQLNAQLIASDSFQPKVEKFQRQWSSLKQAGNEITTWDTGLDYQLLWFIGEQSIKYNTDFNIHPHLLKTHVNARKKRLAEATKIDWATAEALAIGSLMYQGNSVRLSGEDVGRGTFSHRHAMLVDQKTNEIVIPLNALKGGHGGQLEIANSVLSEEAVLGFEYGMAIDNPNNLIIWESQFGDFFNGAQIIFDTFIASGESKWLQSNGMVILLPHGYDGAASEHSSCRIERFLQLTDSNETSPDGDDINMQVINPTTPAQYFHALRRQMVRNFRKPLIVVAPKTLLRLSAATSSQKQFEAGTYFKAVIGDESVTDSKQVTKIILCSGKHYYNLDEYRKTKNRSDCAIIRVESLCPFPVNEINQELEKFKNVTSVVWSQEEHRNMGAWSFVKPRFENMCGKKIKYCGRYEGSTTAIGISSEHKKEAQDVIEQPFK